MHTCMCVQPSHPIPSHPIPSYPSHHPIHPSHPIPCHSIPFRAIPSSPSNSIPFISIPYMHADIHAYTQIPMILCVYIVLQHNQILYIYNIHMHYKNMGLTWSHDPVIFYSFPDHPPWGEMSRAQFLSLMETRPLCYLAKSNRDENPPPNVDLMDFFFKARLQIHHQSVEEQAAASSKGGWYGWCRQGKAVQIPFPLRLWAKCEIGVAVKRAMIMTCCNALQFWQHWHPSCLILVCLGVL